ncbi:MAG: hypothetical protein II230_08105, partial [Clostridia bacterium]|nr:hypothetical protein [Clostridia bacterium]
MDGDVSRNVTRILIPWSVAMFNPPPSVPSVISTSPPTYSTSIAVPFVTLYASGAIYKEIG